MSVMPSRFLAAIRKYDDRCRQKCFSSWLSKVWLSADSPQTGPSGRHRFRARISWLKSSRNKSQSLKVLGVEIQKAGKHDARNLRTSRYGPFVETIDELGSRSEMTSKPRQDCFSVRQRQAACPIESGTGRFETFENVPSLKPSLNACFNRHLQTLFPVPLESSQPEAMECLLSEIRTKLRQSSFS